MARSCAVATSPPGSSPAAPAAAPRWPPSTGTPPSPPSPAAASPAPAANDASSSYRPASPQAPLSASATPSPASTTTTPPGWSPQSGTRPENDQRTRTSTVLARMIFSSGLGTFHTRTLVQYSLSGNDTLKYKGFDIHRCAL